MTQLKATTEWLRANPAGRAADIGVDREAKMIRGYIVAEEGPFKSGGRGEFDQASIRQIQKMIAAEPKGLKSHFAHATLSADGLGRFLGRTVNPRLSREQRGDVERLAVRADLQFSQTAFEGNPNGDLAGYLLNLAEEDPDAIGASLVLQVNREYRLDAKGQRARDKSGEELPPLWRPTVLHASDIVDDGDATRAFLSMADDEDAKAVWAVSEILDRKFPDADRQAIRSRCIGWLDRYLDNRFGELERISAARDPRIRRIGFTLDNERDADRL